MAGGGKGIADSQGAAGISPAQAAIGRAALQGYNPQATMQQVTALTAPPSSVAPPAWANYQTKPLMIGQGPLPTTPQGYADGGSVFNPSFMQYQGQGQPNQPQLMPTQYNGGPDSGADYAPSNMGFDGSGSDGGVAGQPAPMQTPLGSPPSGMTSGLPQQQGNKPLGLAQFQSPQGLQIAGNPTSQVVQRPQQR